MSITKFRTWQKEAFERFFQQPLCYLIAPPGQGKSVVGQAYAMHWAERGKKVLIATPRNLILPSFQGEITLSWDSTGLVDSPTAQEHTFSYNPPECSLATWLVQDTDQDHPYFITTHAGALSAIRTLASKYGDLPHKFKDLVVVIDEAHRLSSHEGSKLGNSLKELVAHKVPVLMMTGTPYRGDNQEILSKEFRETFIVYNREFYRTLDEAEYLSSFETKVVVGNTLTVLRHVLTTLAAEDRYAVIKLPNVNSHHPHRLARELGINVDGHTNHTEELKAVFNKEIETICFDLGLSCLSVVMDDTRDEELEKLLTRSRSSKNKEEVANFLPRVIISQNKIDMGVDCPWWTDSIMLGASKSSTETIQFGMRCCRDHISKSNKSVRYWTLVPDYWEPDVSQDKVFQFAQDLVTIQLWWQFLGSNFSAPTIKTKTAHGVTPVTTPHDNTYAIPPSPTWAELITKSIIEGNETHVIPMFTIDVHTPDGTLKTIKIGHGTGNKLSPLEPPILPEDIIQTSRNFLDQIATLAKILINKGEGKKYDSFLRKSQITAKLIIDLFRAGKSEGEISAETGWCITKVSDVLKQDGLLKTLTPKKRVRGIKED